ncbi:helix-turn-helix transcriptional regulator [Paenibacillus antri]|uniref:Helix-turn-helix transcriptional regulator n=1 Tax=Paenibacillus antri TaxID=2582848 RepID=A0A5R9G8L7_9BACL|nr:helix-turn-helix domain-containing protein [Paenibacillus antri]TLS52752.1 helix-turn-helix transcriptional regulator [Paenibacillus antri]
MKNNWFNRLLLSYLPVFFIVIAVLIVTFFFTVSELVKRQAEQSSRVFSQNIQQTVNDALFSIDLMLRKELENNAKIRQYFADDIPLSNHFQMYEVIRELDHLKLMQPIIDNIYLYRKSDDLVLGTPTVPLEQFADREFLKAYIDQPVPFSWTNVRSFKLMETADTSTNVVTLVRKVPLLTGELGIAVVNVKVQTLALMLEPMLRSNLNYTILLDGVGQTVFTTEASQGGTTHAQVAFSSVVSEYTNWEVRSGLRDGFLFQFVSTLGYIWVGVGLITVAAGTIWLLYVSRRNYKPIESLMHRLNDYLGQRSSHLLKGADAFSLIGSAIDELIEESSLFAKQQKQSQTYRRRVLIRELIEGRGNVNKEEWLEASKALLGAERNIAEIRVVVIEMDKYQEFIKGYSDRDQYLLKFVLSRVMEEAASQLGMVVWSDWNRPEQLSVLLFLEQPQPQSVYVDLCETVRAWVDEHVDYTVTIGIGSTAERLGDVVQSHQEAVEALNYKSTLGNNKVIGYWDIWSRPHGETFDQLQKIRALSQSFRMGERKWEQELNSLFRDLKSGVWSRDEIADLMNFLQFNLYREIVEFSSDLQEDWQESIQPQLIAAVSGFESLDELHARFEMLLRETATKINGVRERRGNQPMIDSIKAFVDENYHDPSLSLQQLGDVFQYSPAHLSTMFKEEIGEKFIDYLVKIRIREARRLLEGSADPVQVIAAKVGYLHSISFIRVFKKLVGKTPGDYRKELLIASSQ